MTVHGEASDNGVDRSNEGGNEAIGVGDHGVVLSVDSERFCVGDAVEESDLASQGDHRVAHGHDHRRRDVDLVEPVSGGEVAEGAACFEDHAPVVARGLGHSPGAPSLGFAAEIHLIGDPVAGLRGGDPGEGRESGEPKEGESLVATLGEVRGGGGAR